MGCSWPGLVGGWIIWCNTLGKSWASELSGSLWDWGNRVLHLPTVVIDFFHRMGPRKQTGQKANRQMSVWMKCLCLHPVDVVGKKICGASAFSLGPKEKGYGCPHPAWGPLFLTAMTHDRSTGLWGPCKSSLQVCPLQGGPCPVVTGLCISPVGPAWCKGSAPGREANIYCPGRSNAVSRMARFFHISTGDISCLLWVHWSNHILSESQFSLLTPCNPTSATLTCYMGNKWKERFVNDKCQSLFTMQGCLCPSVSGFVPAGLCPASSFKVLHAVRVPSAGQIVWKLRSPPHALEQAAESSGQCGLVPQAPMGAPDDNACWSPACRFLI